MAIEKLIVNIELEGEEFEVGELVYRNRNTYFKYFPSFYEKGIEISPFKLPLSREIQSGDPEIFEGLFGVFNDSLPDGWGRLLLDRALLKRSISLSTLTPLDRLSFVGKTGMGAINYQPETGLSLEKSALLDLDSIAHETKKILSGSSTDVLDELFTWGGSSGGARPKIFVGYNPESDHLISGAERLPADYEHWIIKFPSSSDPEDIANIEFAYYQMALDAGIHMNPCRLFSSASGRKYFGTKRFDRDKENRIHMHSASGLMHNNFRLSNMDYGHLMDCGFRLERSVEAYEKVLRLGAFNVYAHNRDDHSKNFSFLMNGQGKWSLAPAYDLIFSISSHGVHSTTVAGEGKSPGKKELLKLAQIYGMKKPEKILDQVKDILTNWKQYASRNAVGPASSQLIQQTLSNIAD